MAIMRALRGPIAQLGERRVRNAEVVSSILIRSTTAFPRPALCWPFQSANSAAPRGGVPERSKGSDCKSDGTAFEGSNPSPSTTFPQSLPADRIVRCICVSLPRGRAGCTRPLALACYSPQADTSHGLLARGDRRGSLPDGSRALMMGEGGESASGLRHASRDCADFVVWPSFPVKPAEGASVASNT